MTAGGRYVLSATLLPATTPYTRSVTLNSRREKGSQFAVGTSTG